jgi:hypothetical protein
MIAEKELEYDCAFTGVEGELIVKPILIDVVMKYGLTRFIYPSRCIYHLFDKGKLVYIGIAENGQRRILQHYKGKRGEFDAFCTFEVSTDWSRLQMHQLESKMIKHWKPKLNIACNN